MSVPDEAATQRHEDSLGSTVSRRSVSEVTASSYDLEFRTPATTALVTGMKESLLVLRVAYGTIAGLSESGESLREETKQRCALLLGPFAAVFRDPETYTPFLSQAHCTERVAVAVATARGVIIGETTDDHLTGDRSLAYEATNILLDSLFRVSEMRDVSRQCRQSGVTDTDVISAMWDMAARGDDVDDLIDAMEDEVARSAFGEGSRRSPG